MCSLHPRKGNAATGKATSRPFPITKPFIRFRIGGGNHPNEACLNLVVDGQVVRTATGNDAPVLSEASWDVSALVGKTGHLEAVDSTRSAERGYILVDDIRFTGLIDFTDLPYQAAVTQMAQRWRHDYGLPGVWCAYIKNGRVVACVADGVKNIETKTPASIHDHLNVGSVSKVITGSLIAFFVANGTIKYETTVGEVFPELAKQYPQSPLLKATLRQLNNHTAGLPKRVELPTVRDGFQYRMQVLQSALKLNNLEAPGTKFEYSNIGPQIAVAEIEKLTGTIFESWLQGPMGKNLGLADPQMLDTLNLPSDAICPYYLESNEIQKGRIAAPYLKYEPSGGCSLTLLDLCAFLNFTFTNSARLPDDLFQRLIQVRDDSNSSFSDSGWQIDGHGALHHSGNTGRGEYCVVFANVQNENAFVFYTNACYRAGKAPDQNFGMNRELLDIHKLTRL